MDFQEEPDLRDQAESARNDGMERKPAEKPATRSWIPTGLLLFIVLAGLPIVTVSSLRSRLITRVGMLYEAMTRGEHPAVRAKVGENQEPFPENLERPILPTPLTSRVYYGAVPSASPADPGVSEADVPSQAGLRPSGERSGDTGGAAQPEYRQGVAERAAYDQLLKSRPTVAGMVEGKDSSLRFVGWSAASMGEGTYWVKLAFARPPADAEAVYIWRVNASTEEITPLNFNARSLPSP